jgi:hypothetical protein
MGIAVGLYATTDVACKPGRVETLAWLQGQLAAGLIDTGEYLGPAADPNLPACGAQVLRSDGALAGWLCADPDGLYRADAAGRDPGSRWQMWSHGTWVEVR